MGDGHPDTFLTLVRSREGRRRELCLTLLRTSQVFFHISTCPNLYASLKSIDVECGLHPKPEGRGQVNLGVKEPKKVHI